MNSSSFLKSLTAWALLGFGAAQAAPLQVSATNSIIADFVKNVGGNRVSVNTIVPVGGDPHTFQPTTGAIRALSGSKMLFANGAGLEPWLPKLTGAIKVPVTELTQGLKLRPAPQEEESGEEHEEHGLYDPHAWWDTELAAGYVKHIQAALTKLDPAGQKTYAQHATAYLAQLKAADTYAKKQLASLPAAKRNIVTNHDALHYFAARYGLKIVGTVIPGLSTEREPSAKEIATLVQNVKKSGAKVIFAENTVNVRLAQTLAAETGAKVAPPLYTDALGAKGSSGETYLKALRYNVDTMVRALR